MCACRDQALSLQDLVLFKRFVVSFNVTDISKILLQRADSIYSGFEGHVAPVQMIQIYHNIMSIARHGIYMNEYSRGCMKRHKSRRKLRGQGPVCQLLRHGLVCRDHSSWPETRLP